MRAAEIQLDAVGARVLGLLDHHVPRFALRLDHQRRDDGMLRIVALDLGDFLQILRDWAIADQLDVVESHHPVLAEVHRAVAGEDVDDGLADRLPDRAAPTLVERFGHLAVGVRWRAGGEPERIGTLDARKVGSQVSHW